MRVAANLILATGNSWSGAFFYKKQSFSSIFFTTHLSLVLFQEKGNHPRSRRRMSWRIPIVGAGWRPTMRISVVLSMIFTMVLSIVPGMVAVEHKIGGMLGWNYPPTQGAGYFANWAAQNQFHVGDSLSFEYIAGTHNVVQVDRADYEACTSFRPMQLYTANKVLVNLSNPGTYYFICGIKGHCEYGMKVALTVK